MSLLTDERAQAIQIGAVLIFGILIIFLSLYQAFVVPDQNEEIEFNHNEELQQQMTELRSNVILMPGSTTTRAASVDLGVRYPSRAIFVNPGPASGTLRTVGTDTPEVNVTITNATAVEDAGETRDFWNGTGLSYDTGALEYQPGYNLYQGAPRTVYEYSVLYNSFDGGAQTLPVTGQTLVDGNRITLVALNGSLTENRVDTLSLDVDPISTRTRVVELNGTGKPVTLQLATGMSEAEWNATFGEELVANGGHVQDVSVSADGHGDLGLLEVTLEAGQRYQLELAKVGVGTGATGTDAEYLTDVEGNGSTLESGETVQLTVEARDRFNGPESGVTVTAAAENGRILGGGNETTDNEGRASFEYQPTGAGTNRVNFTIDPAHNPSGAHDAGSPRNVTMLVEVEAPAEDDGGGPVAYNTTWLDPSGQPGTEACDNETCTFNYSKATTLDLTANTDPTANNVSVDFGVENRSIGTVNPSQRSTGSDGQATTTFRPQDNGTVNVYAWSGGSGDAIEIEVIEYQPGGFQTVGATSILPTADEQSQSFVFRLDDDLPSDESLDIVLDSAQQTSPLQVDYGSASISANRSLSNTNVNAGSDTATLSVSFTNDLSAGEAARVTVTPVNAGSLADQSDPYETVFQRSDVASNGTDSFEVSRNSGSSALQSVTAEDVVADQTGQVQNLTFTLDRDLDSGEIVTIDLSDAQNTSGSTQVDYRNRNSVTVVSGSGFISNFNANTEVAYFQYTAGSSDVAGDTIEIQIDGVDAGPESAQSDPYDVGFSRGDAGTTSASFDVVPSGA